jgi:DNA-directed RNA polymerase subunit RPC12/RpoP
MIVFPCLTCGKKLRAGGEHAGRRAKCSGCGQIMIVPEHSPTPPREVIWPTGALTDPPRALPASSHNGGYHAGPGGAEFTGPGGEDANDDRARPEVPVPPNVSPWWAAQPPGGTPNPLPNPPAPPQPSGYPYPYPHPLPVAYYPPAPTPRPTDEDDEPRRRRRRRRRSFECPYCGSDDLPSNRSQISAAGWAVFVVGFLVCLPLCLIGLFITEQYRVCRDCGARLG